MYYFPCLDTLVLSSLFGLKRIDGGDTIHGQFQGAQVIGACWSLCQYPRRISINTCNELSSLVPWMKEVFESESSTNIVDEESPSGGAGTSTTLTLENITISAVPQISNLKSVSIYECDLLPHIFTFSTPESLKQLKVLKVIRCKAIQVIVKEENGTSSKGVVFPCLETLELKDLPSLKDSSDPTVSKGMPSFHNLIEINVSHKNVEKTIIPSNVLLQLEKIEKIKNMWRSKSQGILLSFPALDTLEIKECPAITVFTKGDLSTPDLNIDDTYPSYLLHPYHHLQSFKLCSDARVKGVLFETDGPLFLYGLPTIQVLKLNGLEEMSHVWKCNWNKLSIPQHQPLQYPFQNLTFISLLGCHKIKYLFSPLMVKFLSNLKDVYICRCSDIEEVISNRDDENEESIVSTSSHQNTTFFPCLDTFMLESLNGLKRIDGGDTIHGQVQSAQEIDACWSLCQYPRCISIDTCNELSSVVPWYAVRQMKKLQELQIWRCERMMEVFESESSTNNVDEGSASETLGLNDLPSLKGFFLGMNDFRWPSLDNVVISDCPEFMVFTSGQSKTPKLKYIETSLGTHRLDSDLNFCGTINQYQNTFPTSSDSSVSKGMPSFHNLIELDVSWENDNTSIIPSSVLLQLEKLEKIKLGYHDDVEEVFEVVALEGSDFNESQTIVQIPNLTQVNLYYLDGLKYLWKSNQWMVLEFPNLTTVDIYRCNSLEHIFTCSMVGSLVQLQDLRIYGCMNLEVIVKEEKECDGKVNEIMLPRLKSLALYGLQSLKGFCLGKEAFSFPALDTLEIKECPAITVFTKGDLSTPDLNVIDTDFGMCGLRGDLNAFIETTQGESTNEAAGGGDGCSRLIRKEAREKLSKCHETSSNSFSVFNT
ncbi:hypothetical protein L1987_06309 [Smallanthus sonchifolius]|uniref:Uncharacterized protein n=1 Tax=Smallanthus sonchifolius TaxID=185202 RepID=A0ACB9JY07_9ASTR|nr:hypothetical protein L1987_06309 [Smallanthus sonchifolius]